MDEETTVEVLREQLDEYGEHLPVRVVQNGREDRFFTIQAVTTTEHPTDRRTVVQIEIGERPEAIRR
jgi:hypothetical protein